jgi:hypothetical protein
MSTIITKNSSTSGSIPSSLIQGELAINVKDGRLFYGSGSGNVVKEFIASGSGNNIDTGSFVLTSSFNAFTSSIYSFTSSISASVNNLTNATSSYVLNSQTSSMFVSSSIYAISASIAVSSSYALSASYASSTLSSSFSTTSSYAIQALSASWTPSSPTFPFTGSALITGSLEITGSLLISGSILPNVSGSVASSFSLGSATNAWKDIWVANSNIYMLDSTGSIQTTIKSSPTGISITGSLNGTISSIVKGEATIDFGVPPGSNYTTLTILTPNVTNNSNIHIYIMSTSSIDHNALDHQMFSLYSTVMSDNIIDNTSFDIVALSQLRLNGTFKVRYTINNN